jgi:hypothetical protein
MPIIFAIYTTGQIATREWVGAEGPCCVDDIGWIVTGKDVNEVVRKHEVCIAGSLNWAESRGPTFDTARSKVAYFTYRQGHNKHLVPKLIARI